MSLTLCRLRPVATPHPVMVAVPVADFTAIQTVFSGEADVTFTGTNGGGAATSYRWQWGDGGEDTTGAGEGTPAEHFYAGAGEYTVIYTLTNAGGSHSKTRTDYITVT